MTRGHGRQARTPPRIKWSGNPGAGDHPPPVNRSPRGPRRARGPGLAPAGNGWRVMQPGCPAERGSVGSRPTVRSRLRREPFGMAQGPEPVEGLSRPARNHANPSRPGRYQRCTGAPARLGGVGGSRRPGSETPDQTSSPSWTRRRSSPARAECGQGGVRAEAVCQAALRHQDALRSGGGIATCSTWQRPLHYSGGRGYAKARVEVRQLLDGAWRVYYHDQLIATQAAVTGPPRQSLRRRRYSVGPSRRGDIFIEQLR